jgi:competence ComEA-like helix-hairpin-helix protein
MRKSLDEFLRVTRLEKHGYLIWLALIGLCWAGGHLLMQPESWPAPSKLQLEAWQATLEAQANAPAAHSVAEGSDASPRQGPRQPRYRLRMEALRTFDPNEVSRARLEGFGLPPWVARNWSRYLAAGGRFEEAGDVAKVYGLEDSVFAKLRPYLRISRASSKPPRQPRGDEEAAAEGVTAEPSKRDAAPKIVNLNQADTAELKTLYGIGPTFAKRIVKYRSLLGGYYKIEQLLEVYGMEAQRLQPIRDQLTLGKDTSVQKIPINTADIKTLGRHPYLKFKEARILIRYREQNGPFDSANALLRVRGVSGKSVEKLLPYLDFSH